MYVSPPRPSGLIFSLQPLLLAVPDESTLKLRLVEVWCNILSGSMADVKNSGALQWVLAKVRHPFLQLIPLCNPQCRCHPESGSKILRVLHCLFSPSLIVLRILVRHCSWHRLADLHLVIFLISIILAFAQFSLQTHSLCKVKNKNTERLADKTDSRFLQNICHT